MIKVTFEYSDVYSNGKWNRQECIVSSLNEAIKLYGLGYDCDYRIISVEELNKDSSHKPTTNN